MGKFNWSHFIRRSVAGITLLVVVLSASIKPLPAFAQVTVTADIPATQRTIKEFFSDLLAALIRNTLNTVLSKLAYDAAVHAASGFKGQSPFVNPDQPGKYLADLVDAAAGAVIESVATTAGLDAAALCDPGDNFRIDLTIGLEINPQGPYKPACTLTELAGNWEEAYSDPDFSKFATLQFDSTANPMGVALEVDSLTIAETDKAQEEGTLKRLTSSFESVQEAVSETILTPGTVVEDQLLSQWKAAQTPIGQSIGKPVVDAVNIFMGTLVQQLLKKAQEGIANLSSGGALAGLISGQEASGTAGGREAAEERFADVQRPTFSSTGEFDILAELAVCDEDPVQNTINSCAIGPQLEQAIVEGMTVTEFNDLMTEGYRFADSALGTADIVGNAGVTPKGIALLKKYRIVPVGWQIAAEYIVATGQSVNLADLVAAYDNCGADDYSEWCGLIDPYWVLKAPQNFCEREAPGPDFAQVQAFDTDGLPTTQDELLLSRLNYCADNRGCIAEAKEDSCTAYGYCTQESRIYRFDGDVCEESYSSCQTFSTEDGDEVSYIKNSLNYNDCATDPGCQWYCASFSDAGEFDCASPTETFISCSEDVADNPTDYGLPAFSVYYNDNIACSCDLTQTCQVRAGSDRGNDSGSYEYVEQGDASYAFTAGDGVYDFYQCVVTNDDGSYTECELDETCGASSASYDATTESCTCTVTNSCDVESGDTSCSVSVEDTDGNTVSNTCTLDDEDGSGGADSCAEDYSTYSTSPVCELDSSVDLDCGSTCTVDSGSTSCVNDLGNTCEDGSTYDADSTAGTCLLVDTCAISSGSYSCTSDSGYTCTLGRIAEDPTVENDTMYFDDAMEECDSSDVGCNRYIRIQSDTNLLPNAFFNYYDDVNILDDEASDFLAFCTHDGGGCHNDASCYEDSDGDGDFEDVGGDCIGWVKPDFGGDGNPDADTYILTNAESTAVTSDVSENYLRIPGDGAGDGTLEMTVDTGSSVADRTFTFAYRALSLDATCPISFTIGTSDADVTSGPITAYTVTADDGTETVYDEYTNEWLDYAVTFTFPDADDADYDDGSAGNAITVSLNELAACDIYLAGTELVEADSFDSAYADYAETNVTYLNGDTLSCESTDVGCELYVETGRDEADGVPGIITNPTSEACLGECSDIDYVTETTCLAAGETWDDSVYNYDNPACNQCNGNAAADQSDDYYAGCGFYQEVSLDVTTPVTTDETWLSAEERVGVMTRYGGYCEFDSTDHCFDTSDCADVDEDGTTDACLERLSIVPSSGTVCGFDQVGCEEYTNLDTVALGGEGLEYYTQLKQCVKTDDGDIAVFYTFEGSDAAGVQIEDHTLKVADSGAPCTHLNLESEDYNAECTDGTTATATDCGPSGEATYGEDPDCRQYIDADGDIFYRYESEVVVASEECLPLRNTIDTRVYYAVPDDSETCSAEFVGCREYKGTDADNLEEIINVDFGDNTTEDWTNATSTSNESVLQSGYSLQLHDDDTSDTSNATISYNLYTTVDSDGDGTEETVGLLTEGKSYILTFWAKVVDNGTVTMALDLGATDYYFTTEGMTTSLADAAETLDPNDEGGWQSYSLGPVILSDSESVDEGDETFAMTFTGSTASDEAYIDNIVLTESDSLYLIQDTARTCNGFEGCREYSDRNDTTHYLKSFQRLCDEEAVGCEAVIDTQNSLHPFTETYNQDNEYDEDDVIVPYDQPTTLVYDEDNECSETVYGCTEFGLPSVNEQSGAVEDYSSAYLLDRPDSYTATLCEQPQLSCREYTSEYDGTVYFKNPGDRFCVLQEYTNEAGNTVTGWFKDGTASTAPDCPLLYDYADPSQPLNGVCNSNSRSDSEDLIGTLCSSDADCYPDDWATGYPRPRCISTLDDDVDKYDGDVHQYEVYSDDSVSLSDRVSDFGWAGQCPSSESGCSEYVDPYSPNILEKNFNASFENDVRTLTGSYYSDEETPDGFPDYWSVPQNSTSVDSGEDDETGAAIYEYSEVDIESDGTVDFDSSCTDDDTSVIIQTGSEAYAGSYDVIPADGASTLEVTNCIVENENYLEIAPDTLYTLQAYVKMPEEAFDDGTNDPAEISIGLRFYGEDSATDTDELVDDASDDVSTDQLYLVANHVTLSLADEYEADDDGLSTWYRLQGNIGLGSTVEWPNGGVCKWLGRTFSAYDNQADCEAVSYTWEPILYARAFVANHSDYPVYFDLVSLKANDKYYYIDYTVDGTAEKEQLDGTNSCVDQDTEESAITADGGCVAFRDVTYDTQTYAQDGNDCSTCLLSPNSDTCRDILDACDTNTVLKVKRDRVCSEWLACETAEIVTDEQGNETTQCFSIGRCVELDEDGNCSEWLPKPGADEMNSSSDVHYSSAAGDNDALSGFENNTGYSKVGLTWQEARTCEDGYREGQSCEDDDDCQDTSVTCSSSVCSDDASKSCDEDSDCYVGTCGEPLAVEGYYPYGWMPEVGEYGASTGEDLIEHNTFEALYCEGSEADHNQACLTNATDTDPKGQCWNNTLEQRATSSTEGFSYNTYYEGATVGDENSYEYYCPNTPEFDHWPFGGYEDAISTTVKYSAHGWQSISGDISISQYDPLSQYYTEDVVCETEDCASIDLNNVLQFTGALQDNVAFTGGVEYDLQDNIVADGTYALAFDGRFVDGGDEDSTMTICLTHNNLISTEDLDGDGNLNDEVERKDCFVNGYGQADIVFAIDTSGSMATEILAVQDAAPALAYLLDQSGIDAKFALLDMDDADASGTGNGYAYIDLDFTSNICDSYDSTTNTCTGGSFNSAVSAMSAEAAYVDPFDAVYDTARNSLIDGSLTFRADANKFIIIVTDTGDEVSNGIGETSATTEAQSADLTVFAVTNGREQCADNDDSPCTALYADLASATGGEVYDYTDPDDTTDDDGTSGYSGYSTSSDWYNDTDIVEDLFNSILSQIELFQMEDAMRTYTFGPITASELSTDDGTVTEGAGGATTDLEFLSSDSTTIQLDNVSLLPVLEVNKDLDTIARSCRAYPAADASACQYRETNGTTYNGWRGYCLEIDPTNSNRCITWWPQDILTGEQSIVQREAAGYTGRSDVYYCLVAKGLATPGFCDDTDSSFTSSDFGQSQICTADSQCGSGDCFNGAKYTIESSNSAGEKDDFDNPHAEAEQDDYAGEYQVRALRWQMHDPADSEGTDDWGLTTYGNIYETGVITRLPANEILRNIHVSEIAGIEFNTGSADDGGGAGAEFPFWGQLGFTGGDPDGPFTSGSPYDADQGIDIEKNDACSNEDDIALDCSELGNWLLTDLGAGAIPTDDDGNLEPWEHCYPYRDGAAPGIGCRVWGLYDSDFLGSYYDSLGSIENAPHGYDLVYTWGWSNFNTEGDCQLSSGDDDYSYDDVVAEGGDAYFENPCIEKTIQYLMGWKNGTTSSESAAWTTSRNPWEHLGEAASFIEDPETSEDVETIYVVSPNDGADFEDIYGDAAITTLGSWSGWEYWDDDGGGDGEGGDIFSVYIDFNDEGYIQAVYTLIYYSADEVNDSAAFSPRGVELTWGNMMHLDLYVRESCALITEAVANDGTNYAWASRSVSGGYEINSDTDDNYGIETTYNPYGAITPQDDTPPLWDFFLWSDAISEDPPIYDATRLGNEPAIAYVSDSDSTAGHPLSCIGDCSKSYCVNMVDTAYNGTECTSSSTCGSANGICMGVGDAEISNAGNSSDGTCSGGSHDGDSCSSDAECQDTSSTCTFAGSGTCEGGGTSDGTSCSTDSDCNYTGPTATCDNIDPDDGLGECSDNSNQACTEDNDCGADGSCQSSSTDGSCSNDTSVDCSESADCWVGSCDIPTDADAPNTYDEQVTASAEDARSRLKHIFADVTGNYYKFDPLDTDADGTKVYVSDGTDYFGTIFEDMGQCVSDDGTRPLDNDDEYCGLVPTVTEISVDGNTTEESGYYEVSNGKTIELNFTSAVDVEQLPLQYLYIDWNDGNTTSELWAADATTHVYTHAYTCSPDTGAYADAYAGSYCDFRPKIVVTDNWLWCSGTHDAGTPASGQQNRYDPEETSDIISNCASYDQPNFYIRVTD